MATDDEGAPNSPSSESLSGAAGDSDDQGDSNTRAGAVEGQCAHDDLDVDVTSDPHGSGAGSSYSIITFTNTGSVECALQGSPIVQPVKSDEVTEIGLAAQREHLPVRTDDGYEAERVELAPGESETAILRMTIIGDSGGPLAGSCNPEQAAGFRILPPHSHQAFFVPVDDLHACSNPVSWMDVSDIGTAPPSD